MNSPKLKQKMGMRMQTMEEGMKQQTLSQQQIMQMQLMQQQMMQQQLMQNQIMEPSDKKMQKENIEDKPNFCLGLYVIFRSGNKNEQPVSVQGMPDEKVSEIIKKYRKKSGDYDLSRKFIFNARALHPSLTMAEAGLTNNANIFVVAKKGIRGG